MSNGCAEYCEGIRVKTDSLSKRTIDYHRCLFLRQIGIKYSMSWGDRETTKRMPHILWTDKASDYLKAHP
jgi:hypothetical protein